MDEELWAAFREEFAAACATLAAAPDLVAARRALQQLRVMADGMAMTALQAQLAELEALDSLDALRAGAGKLAVGAAGPHRILIVDDSAMMRRMLRGILAQEPRFAVVGEEADGAAGLDAVAELRPDLTLLDLEMPVLDGMGFLAEWALSGHGAVVVVSSAAHPGSPAALEVLRRGAHAAVAKPSGALSLDIAERAGAEILAAARSAVAP